MGTVGSGVLHLLQENREIIRQRTGVDINLKTICDLRAEDIRKGLAGITVTREWKEITDDPDIDIVIELIGGIEPARSIILEALSRGKSVVTANKKLLAEEGEDIFDAVNRLKVKLGFEAAVGGGIPCILALKSGLAATRVHTIVGILNGTTNYILTRMEEEGLVFDEALRDAQEKGFAEADPTFDIKGLDAGHKIALLSLLAYGRKVDYRSIAKEGITEISELDIMYAREMGYVIKLLGISKLVGDEVDIRVHPTMLHRNHPLASIRNEFNAVMYISDMTGPVILHGKGAGSHPTASAVVSDVIQIAQGTDSDETLKIGPGSTHYLLPEKRLSRYYIRVHTEDKPGILSRISGVLGKYDISIASVIQKESGSRHVPLLIMTHSAYEEGVLQAVKEINNFDFVEGNVTLIRVEDADSLGEVK